MFLDDRDRKMVLVRSTMRAVELEDSGIGPDQRFAFYDQVSNNIKQMIMIFILLFFLKKTSLTIALGSYNWYGYQAHS